MSEPLSNHDIEDVVSSIRRLVSTEPRTKTRDLSHDRLLLTPSLRVVVDAGQAAAIEPVAVEVAVVAEEPAEAVADAVSAAQGPLILDEAQAVEVGAEAGPGLIEAEWEDLIWEEPEPSLAEITEAIDEAELVTAAEAVVQEAPAEAVAAAGEEAGGGPIQFHSYPRAVPSARLETAEDDLEVDILGMEPAGLDAAVRRDGDLAAQGADPVAAVAEPGFPMLDEDVLSEIVRDLIREELQGALGERITRNVRKLVRAEINRALASRAYE